MELRFRLFERLCLPSMTGQGDGDFHLIVLAAEAMPFALATDATAIPLECSAVREPWRDASQGADASPSSVQLARRATLRWQALAGVERAG